MTDVGNSANFPGPSAPIDASGQVLISQPWLQFFLALLARTGGNGIPSSDVADLLSQIKALQAQANDQSIVLKPVELQQIIQTVADLWGEMRQPDNQSQIQARLQDLENAITLLNENRSIPQKLDELEGRLLDFKPQNTPVLEQWNAATLNNSWVYFGAPTNPVGYWKDPVGIVHLRGVVKSGTIGLSVFTLPVGYRPLNTEYFAVVSNGAFGRVVIGSDGGVTPDIGSNAYVTFDGITFRAA